MTQEHHPKHKHSSPEEPDFVEREHSLEPSGEESKKENPDFPREAVEEKNEELITIPLQEYASQMKEIDDLKSKNKDYADGWQRERADFSNYRARILRDQEFTRQDLVAQVAKKYLAVNDDIELALKHAPEEKDSADWVNGVRLIAQKLQNILESEGVQRIPAEKEIFDPHRHEAITVEDNPLFPSGQVIEVIQQGYTIGDRVIRPARVKVAK